MNPEQILKSSQEQAVAAWVDRLNQIRLDKLLEKLASQDINLDQALAELQQMKENICSLITNNRGGIKGLHGFIAEATEVGIENARNLIKGLDANCKWVNNNGPADLLRGNTEIQQKFVRAGGHFGLEAVREHLEKYPYFIKDGGKYQLPKDFYEEIQRLLELSQEDAAKESTRTYGLWKWIQKFFSESGIKPDNIEPAVTDYPEVQAGNVAHTVEKAKNEIKAEDQHRRDVAYKDSTPTLKQGMQATAVSAIAEGGMAFCLGVAKNSNRANMLRNSQRKTGRKSELIPPKDLLKVVSEAGCSML